MSEQRVRSVVVSSSNGQGAFVALSYSNGADRQQEDTFDDESCPPSAKDRSLRWSQTD